MIERAVPMIPGDDLAVARRFYADGLGFSVTFEVTDDGCNGLMGLERGPFCLTVDCPMSGHGRNICVTLHVNDADALYAAWLGKVDIPRPPQNEDWGYRTFGMTDPFGNTIFVIGPLLGQADGLR